MWLAYVLAGVALLAAMSGGLALAMHLFAPRMSEARRIMWAAAGTTVLPASIAVGGFLSEAEVADSDFALGFAALMLTALAVFAACCLPAAWFTTTRLARTHKGTPAIEAVTPELIEG